MKHLTASRSLARLMLRRDRLRVAIWTALAVGLVWSSAVSVKGLYPTQSGRDQYAATVGGSPSSRVLGGPGYGVHTLGGITVNESETTVLVLIAVFSCMLVVRHTRKEEETGRAELLAATVLGRHARLAATLGVVAGIDVIMGAAIAGALIATGLPVPGSLAYGAGVAAVGLFFAGVGAVTAQWAEHSRTANGAALAVFGVAFGLRALGDSQTSGAAAELSWLSPIGWAQQVRAYAGERWWTLALPVAGALVLAAAAAGLSRRRDIGAGLRRPRRGPAVAGPRLSGPLGLAWRLQRGAFLAWTITAAVAGAVFGAIAGTVSTAVGRNSQASDVLARLGGGGAVVDDYLAWVFGTAGAAAAVFAVLSVSRLRSEELDVHADPVLATAVTRSRWMGAHLVLAYAGMVLFLAVTGLAAGIAHGIGDHRPAHEVGRALAGALVQVPAAAVLAGIGIALFGLLPRFGAVVWVCLLGSVLLGQFGDLLRLSRGVMAVSPFSHVPRLPGGHVQALPLLELGALAVATAVVGVAQFRRRDIVLH
ncbi:ABC transporter permease [Catenulispora rubra]|uniref:ABC transporter permease n=1 Tax=Catenulispora rubra TaxID=280293 RepID=UPI001892425D|nr:ABC transporter permease [Catenulispora rubra]